MESYSSAVNSLLTLGRPLLRDPDPAYGRVGLTAEHTPELLRLMQDEELSQRGEPECYAQVHAWRALAQFRAEAAIEPMLDMLTEQEDDEDWDDWVTEDMPQMLGLIGPAALPATVARLDKRSANQKIVTYFAQALTEIAKRHPEVRHEVVTQLCRILETAATNDDGANGFVIANLLDLNAVEAWPAIEKAFATENVDEFIVGDADDVKYELGLGPKPPKKPPMFQWGSNRDRDTYADMEEQEEGEWTTSTERPEPTGYVPPPGTGLTPKERADARAKQRKAEKRQNKKKRKGK